MSKLYPSRRTLQFTFDGRLGLLPMPTRTIKVNGQRLRKLMNERVVTPEAVATRIGRSPKTIYRAMDGGEVFKATLNKIAAALNVEAGVLADLGADTDPVRVIEIVIRGPVGLLENSPHVRALVALLNRVIGTADVFKFDSLSLGSIRVGASEEGAAALAVLFPNFQEHALEEIARMPGGEAYFAGHPLAEEEGQLRGLVDLVECVAELRVGTGNTLTTATPAAPPEAELNPAASAPADTPESKPPARPPAEPFSNPYLHWDLAALERFLGEAEAESPGPDRDLTIRQITEAIDFTRAVARYQAENPET
ncbi:MAG: helix-turn-helix transcriptional regulator [Gemmataceae bacterium]